MSTFQQSHSQCFSIVHEGPSQGQIQAAFEALLDYLKYASLDLSFVPHPQEGYPFLVAQETFKGVYHALRVLVSHLYDPHPLELWEAMEALHAVDSVEKHLSTLARQLGDVLLSIPRDADHRGQRAIIIHALKQLEVLYDSRMAGLQVLREATAAAVDYQQLYHALHQLKQQRGQAKQAWRKGGRALRKVQRKFAAVVARQKRAVREQHHLSLQVDLSYARLYEQLGQKQSELENLLRRFAVLQQSIRDYERLKRLCWQLPVVAPEAFPD